MSKEELQRIMNEMAKEYGIFCSEADFQFCLAQKLKECYPKFHFWLEYPMKIDEKCIYVDIFMTNETQEYYIELKYKTKKLNYTAYKKKLEVKDLELKNQSAQDIGAVLYHKDIKRLEEITVSKEQCIGYAIFLTNDEYYYKETIAKRKKEEEKKYKNCFFRDGIIKSDIEYPNYKANGNPDKMEHNEYNSQWLSYEHQNETKTDNCGNFKYIITEIKKG